MLPETYSAHVCSAHGPKPMTRLVLMALASTMNSCSVSHVNRTTLARLTGLSASSVSKHLASAQAEGWVREELDRWVGVVPATLQNGGDPAPDEENPPEAKESAKLASQVRTGSQEVRTSASAKSQETLRLEASFSAFWDLVPRKVNKGGARRAFAAALRAGKVSEARLLSATRAWALSVRERVKQEGEGALRFVPHPATWLNGERWADQAEPVERQFGLEPSLFTDRG